MLSVGAEVSCETQENGRRGGFLVRRGRRGAEVLAKGTRTLMMYAEMEYLLGQLKGGISFWGLVVFEMDL